MKIVVCDAETGEVVRSGRAAHPEGTEVHPDAWQRALYAAGKGLLGHLSRLRAQPKAYGGFSIFDLLELRENTLREFGFRDIYKYAGRGRERVLGVHASRNLAMCHANFNQRVVGY